MMKADYELRHKLYGQQGSLWERQVDAKTRGRIRAIVAEAGHASTLATLDRVAASTINARQVLVEDVFFHFLDGDFAVVGKQQAAYSHRSVVLPDGSRAFVGFRTGSGSYSTDPVPNLLAISDAFLNFMARPPMSVGSNQSRDWYLVPTPSDLRPIVIQGKNYGEYLVHGIDFLAFDGYIALVDSPTEVLPLGLVKVNSAYRLLESPNNFVLSSPSGRSGNKWMAEYAYKTQSLEAFRRAAAEYAGMYVFNEPDVVLGVYDLGGVAKIYSMAVAGPVTILYPHNNLVAGQTVEPGYIVSQRFELVTSRHLSAVDDRKIAATGWEYAFSMDGVLPVNGLTWNGGAITIEAGATDPVTGKVHARMMFGGPQDSLEALWRLTEAQERASGLFWIDQLGGSYPKVIDGWAMLQQFYGSQLILALVENHDPAINNRLWRFLIEHHPKSCNLLLSMDLAAESQPAAGGYNEPLVDESGNNYIMPTAPDVCTEFMLSVQGNPLYILGNPLTYTICAD